MFTESVEAEPSKPAGWMGLLELFSGESDDAVRLGKIIPILRELVKVFSALKKIPKVLPHYNPNPNLTATCFAPMRAQPYVHRVCRCASTKNNLSSPYDVLNNGTKLNKF